MDPRFGQVASSPVDYIGKPIAGPVPVPHQAPGPRDNETVGERIQAEIRGLQSHIKRLELLYHNAREMGIVNERFERVREVIWF